ncbi:MAG: ABC transporter ATP-binding protein [Deltaproteobacteria bacterium]|nr:ABC transporter ATP-binding protein [Deltaproteobacteria bacterium]MBW2658000.1 ABC transporter ATP-binding protein [Deltaproteobacteria bacterium]
MNNHPLYDIADISFGYDATPVLQDLSFTLESGKFYGIVGPNGCGKTTLLDLLIGNRIPLSGSVSFKGKIVSSYHRRTLAQQISLVPQEFDTGFGYTVEEIVLMGRHPYISRFASPSAEDWQRVDQAMKTIGIDDLKNRYTNELSGGQKQRTVVARALAQNTDVLIFDEATSSLDVKYSLEIFNVARRLVLDKGRTVIAVIHNLNLAAAYCDKLLFMKDGKIACYGPTAEVMTPETIAGVFDISSKVSHDPYSRTLQVNFRYWD